MTCGGGRAPEGVLLLRCLCEQPLWSLLLLWLALTSRQRPLWEKGCILRGGILLHSVLTEEMPRAQLSHPALPSSLEHPSLCLLGCPRPAACSAWIFKPCYLPRGLLKLWEIPLCLCHQVGGIKAAPPPPHSSTTPTINSLQLSFLSDQRFRKQSSKQVLYRHGHLTGG